MDDKVDTGCSIRIRARLVSFFEGRMLNDGDWVFWLLMMTVVFLVCNFQLVLGQAVGRWDTDSQYMQYYVLVADFARAGRFLYWDPWSNGGIPLMGDPQVGAFSPVTLLFGLITGGSSTGFIVYWLSMWWLGGLGIMILARHFKAPPWGGFLVAVGFLFSGAYMGHAQHTSIIIGLSYMPFIVWRLDVALTENRLKPAVEAGALWGLSALSGYPAFTIITGCFAALWGLGRYITMFFGKGGITSDSAEEDRGMKISPSLGFLCVTLAVICLLGSSVLVPTYFSYFHEGAGHHTRVGSLSRLDAIWTNALHPGALATFSSNYLSVLQMGNRGILWPYTDVSMSSIYAGSVIIVLAVFGLLGDFKNRWKWWLVFLALVSLACALGRTLPLRGWLYDWVYPMRFFRHAGIFRVYYLLSLSILALYGARAFADGLKKGDQAEWTRFLMPALFLGVSAVIVYFLTYLSVPNGDGVEDVKAIVHLLFAWGGIVSLSILGRKWISGRQRWKIAFFIIMLVSGDAFLGARLAKRTILDYNYVRRWQNLDKAHSSVIDLTDNGLYREERAFNRTSPERETNNDQLITKVPVFEAYATEINDFHMLMAADRALSRLAVGRERIWFSNNALAVSPTRAAYEAWAEKVKQGVPTLLIHEPQDLIRGGFSDVLNAQPELDRISTLPPLRPVEPDGVRYWPDELAFEVTCPDEGWLLVTDRWGRNWEVEVNSKKETVYGGNFIFRAVKVSQGLNTVRFTFHPTGFPWLIAVSWGILAAVLVVSIFSSYQSRRKEDLETPL